MQLFIIFCLICGSLGSCSRAPAPLSEKTSAVSEKIGVKTVQYKDAKRGRPIFVELWYPTQEEKALDEPLDPIWIHPKEVRDVSLANIASKYPLIVMSHGHGGDRRDRSWLAER